MVPPVSAGEFTIEFFEDDDGRSPVEEWMDSDLTDLELAALVSGLEHVLSHRGIDVCRTEWGKQLGEGLSSSASATRRPRSSTCSPARRLAARQPRVRRSCFVSSARLRRKVVLLLNGYDKADDPSDKRQQREITLARRRLVVFKARQALERKKQRRGGGRDS